MSLEDVEVAIDVIKERLTALEQVSSTSEIYNTLDECRKAAATAKDMVKRAAQLMERAREAEIRMLVYHNNILQVNEALRQTLQKWSDYFSMKDSFNLRTDKALEIGKKIASDLNSIAYSIGVEK